MLRQATSQASPVSSGSPWFFGVDSRLHRVPGEHRIPEWKNSVVFFAKETFIRADFRYAFQVITLDCSVELCFRNFKEGVFFFFFSFIHSTNVNFEHVRGVDFVCNFSETSLIYFIAHFHINIGININNFSKLTGPFDTNFHVTRLNHIHMHTLLSHQWSYRVSEYSGLEYRADSMWKCILKVNARVISANLEFISSAWCGCETVKRLIANDQSIT